MYIEESFSIGVMGGGLHALCVGKITHAFKVKVGSGEKEDPYQTFGSGSGLSRWKIRQSEKNLEKSN